MDSHGRPVCADGHTRTHTDSHGQLQTSCVCWRTATDVLCVLNRQPTWARITQTVHGKGRRAESKDQRADMCADGHPRTSSTEVLCVLADTHGRPVCTEQTAHRADMCTDGRPRISYSPRGPESPKQSTGRASVLSPRTNVLICVLMDSHGFPVCADRHTRTATDVLYVLCVLVDTHGRPVQPTWAKITQTVHGKDQRGESKDQRADMCTDGQPRTSCSTGRTSVLSPSTTVLICVLIDSHGRPVCADRHTRTATDTDTHEQPRISCVCWRTPTDVLCVLNRQPTWAKITQTLHGKGQRAESKDQRADMCTDGQPRAQPPWAKITQTVHGKGQRAESKDQRADMCTDGQPRTSCVCRRKHTDTNGLPRTSCVCWRTPRDVLCILNRQPT
ncbi:unnamed protein product [Brassica rapa]|uniref:Uncharacterized protein n=1 Tax=Brassica campestris TaxID=3711 RepID=A0A8D9DIM2_BRACM|nr:unnamed protein product [Brassica rapa]